MSPAFRPAVPADAQRAVPLIYASGPRTLDYVFATERKCAEDFLLRAFVDGRGEFGFQNHVVGTLDEEVIAVGAAFCGASMPAFTYAGARQILALYGARGSLGVFVRGLRVERVIVPPTRDLWYLAHLGVADRHRGRGIGRALVAHLLGLGRQRGFTRAALDVAVDNPHAERLYGRLGFTVTGERSSRLSNARAAVPSQRRMELGSMGAAGSAASMPPRVQTRR